MNDRVRPDEAARALAEIGQRQEQVIRLSAIPTWFWWVIGGLMVGFSAAVDSRRPVVIAVGATVFGLGVAASVGYVVVNSVRRAQVRNDLLGAHGALAIVAFTVGTVAASLAAAFGAEAAGLSYPGTLGSGVGAALLVIGGPLLMRYLYRVMLSHRTGRPR